MPRPFLILSDAVSSGSGLARIASDIAIRTAKMSELRVATIGPGGVGSSRFPFQQYSLPELKDWIVPQLPHIVDDFCSDERPIIFTIWDSTRLGWLANHLLCPPVKELAELREWVKARNFDLYGYFPLDADTIDGGVGIVAEQTLTKYDRVLMYTEWASGVASQSLLSRPPSLPHGISDTFQPIPMLEARQRVFPAIPADALLIGIVATNQSRKDWALGLQVAAALKAKGHKVVLWLHVDHLTRYWDIFGLLHSLDLATVAIITSDILTDEEMNNCYAACNVTLGIGLGEGFGYPIFESIASGTPCIHGRSGGAPEFMPTEMIVDVARLEDGSEAWRIEGFYSNRRPVFEVEKWVNKVERNIHSRVTLPLALRWKQLWPRFESWIREGL
jgi:glycosyltransferase involved in cell wall biosynthesis